MFEGDVKITINKILVFENNDKDRTFYMRSMRPALGWAPHENHFDEAHNYEQALRFADTNAGYYSGCVIGRIASFRDNLDIPPLTLEFVDRLVGQGIKHSAIAVISHDKVLVQKVRELHKTINTHYIPVSGTPSEVDSNRKEIDKFLFEYAHRLV
ncbi:hypothetical protein HYW20_06370 [Candidatus Woesearchaeota archaeon]|nr:hypothetical protein [Candidatus Woesearchaeota archaeon]